VTVEVDLLVVVVAVGFLLFEGVRGRLKSC
jgi:hypothetical protein